MAPRVTVRAMTGPEFDAWQAGLAEQYAQEQVDAGNWAAEDALERSRQDSRELLPEGARTEGMLFLTGDDDAGTAIGVVWISLIHPRGVPDCAFVYDIEVRPGYRGAGYGRALLDAAEQEVARRGVRSLMLNVFGTNTVALDLYRSNGYRVVSQQMRKDLDPRR